MIPFYLSKAPFTPPALLDLPPDGVPYRVPVLICPPWGWEEVASYRTRREWAERLAAAGHPTVRFELPGTGDSDGDPGTPDLVADWVAATVAAAEQLTDLVSGSAVAAIGLGLGGLLLRASSAAGAPISDAVLWGAPASGRGFTRELRAFSRLQDGRPMGPEGETLPSPLPEGALEVGGFVLSAETSATLKDFDPEPRAGTPLRRVLDLGRDGIAPEPAIGRRLREAGAEVETGDGSGWEQMVAHPEQTRLPETTVALIESWLQRGEHSEPCVGRATLADDRIVGSIELHASGVAFRETPLRFPLGFGNAFGIFTEPVGEAFGDGLCALFLNPGAIRHIGPNRMWVEAARRWALRGVPSLRVDLEGIGEADGGHTGRDTVGAFYVPGFVDQLRGVLDALESRGGYQRFVLVGLCAGAYWAYRSALDDPRVEAAVLLNAGALSWADDILDQRQVSKLGRIKEGHWWLKLLRGEIKIRRVLYFVRLAFQNALDRRHGDPGPGHGSDLDADLDRSRGTHLVMAFSEDEPLFRELELKGIVERRDRWPNLELCRLPGSDHTLRSAAAQVAAHELLDAELERFV